MNHNIRKTLTATLLIAAVLLTAAAAGAAYEPAAIDPPLSPHLLSIQADPAQQANQLAWTPYRRLTAQPPATDEISPEMMANALAIRQVLEPAAEPGFVPGSLPQPGAEAQAQVDFSQEWTSSQAGENAAAGASHAGDVSATPSNLFGAEAYSSFYANQFAAMWKHYPYRAIGKLYFDTPNGPAYCTASVIGPDLIVTAARCIMDTTSDTIYNNFAFCPAARGSVCPFGSYPWAGILLHFAYLEAASWTEVIDVDVALIHLEVNKAGRSVQTYTGWLGLAWNLPARQHSFAFGYLATRQGSKFSHACAGQANIAGTNVLEMGCDSGFGHTGGPWLVRFAPQVAAGANYISSVTSYQYTRGGNAIGGARFTSENIGQLCDAIDEC